ncbi:MAG: FixH family protein [Comamonas sp.]
MNRIATQPAPEAGKPWWKFLSVWLLLSGPALVVVAGVATAWIAARGQDPVIDDNYYQNGLNINQRLAQPQKSLAPALKARNHAATPAADQPK